MTVDELLSQAITRRDLRIILVCQEGYRSSLAAVTLQQLGLAHATDLGGGFTTWTAAGLPGLPGQDTPAGCHLLPDPYRLDWPGA
jgi:rhodanese-related sulfurtransferase